MATVFTDPGYRGMKTQIPYGVTSPVSNRGIPVYTISSIQVQPFTKVELYPTPAIIGTPMAVLNGPINIPDLSKYTTYIDNLIAGMRVTWVEPSDSVKLACCSGERANCGALDPNGAMCKSFWQSYCTGDRMKNASCRKWANENRDLATPAVMEFCRKNPTDPFCTCINSKVNGSGLGVNPACIDAACIQTGFKTSNMMTPCPPIYNCEQVNNITNMGVQISSTANTELNCGGTITKVESDGFSGTVIFMLFMFFVLIAAALALAFKLVIIGNARNPKN
jgi:hypothetical protein